MSERYPHLQVQKLSPLEWASLAAKAHSVVFHERRPFEMERIDYALLVLENGLLMGYLTVREFDQESAYWQYGGGFPSSRDQMKAFYSYKKLIDWSKEQGYKRITTLIESDNVRMMKLAMKFGFRVIGVRMFEKNVLVEFLNDLSHWEHADAE